MPRKPALNPTSFLLGLLLPTSAFLLTSQNSSPARSASSSEPAGKITTTGISVLDEDGKERLVLGKLPEGDGNQFGVCLKDTAGKKRVQLAYSEEFGPEITVRDAAGRPRCSVTSPTDQEVSLLLFGKNGESVASMTVMSQDDGCNGYLLVRDSRGRYLSTLPTSIADGRK